jgi:hypothetical protein
MRRFRNSRLPYYRTVPSVYGIRYGFRPGGPIKIGFSDQTRRRFQNLRGVRKPIVFVMVIPGSFALEKLFHAAFAPLNLTHESDLGKAMGLGEKESEWFSWPDRQRQKQLEWLLKRLHQDNQAREWFVQDLGQGWSGEFEARWNAWVEKVREFKAFQKSGPAS